MTHVNIVLRLYYWARFWVFQRRWIRKMSAKHPKNMQKGLEIWDKRGIAISEFENKPYWHNQYKQSEYLRKCLKKREEQ